jgi:predicted small secreted protein
MKHRLTGVLLALAVVLAACTPTDAGGDDGEPAAPSVEAAPADSSPTPASDSYGY